MRFVQGHNGRLNLADVRPQPRRADDEGVLRSVAIVEYPKGRGNVDGVTLEITRLASDGTRNACSILYGAFARAAFALGYRRLITYIREDEGGASLRASGYRLVGSRPARPTAAAAILLAHRLGLL